MEAIQIYVKDIEYGKALAEAVSRKRKNLILELQDTSETAAIHLTEYCTLDEFLNLLDQYSDSQMTDSSPGKKSNGLRDYSPEKCTVYAVTGKGGSGVSLCSWLMARILAEFREKDVLFITLGAVGPSGMETLIYRLLYKEMPTVRAFEEGTCRNAGVWTLKGNDSVRNDAALTVNEVEDFLFSAASSGLYDCIVVDIPHMSPYGGSLFSLAEHVIGISDYRKGSDKESDLIISGLKTLCEERLCQFSPEEDPYAFEKDIYGQLGQALYAFMKEEEIL